MNIAANLKAIEQIKSEVLTEVANLYRTLADYDEIADYNAVENSISTIVAMDYILAKHLGITHSTRLNRNSAICRSSAGISKTGYDPEKEQKIRACLRPRISGIGGYYEKSIFVCYA